MGKKKLKSRRRTGKERYERYERYASSLGLFVAVVLILAAIGWGTWCWFRPSPGAKPFPAVISPELKSVSLTPPSEGQLCVKCHAREVEEWSRSQHANACRLVNPKADFAAFNPSQIQSANGSRTILRSELGAPTIAIMSPDGSRSIYHPEAAIGVSPLVQYLVGFPGGRLQTLNFAFDPKRKDWFDSQGQETRLPKDWSHWQNRGMNWNSQCAFCHMTNLRKGYSPEEDVYRTTWDAMGISCAQCHGKMERHAANPKDRTLLKPLPVKLMIDSCGSCHARREELTGRFQVGEKFDDHYRLSLPDQPGLYYPDGQVKEEDFEYGSFLMSRMGHKGISCLDCHNPHSGKLRIPAENNALCLSCHTPPGQRGAIPIDLATHSHHQPGAPGDRCVDCHMPITRYMVRDPRRDHGFTIPDPVLTKESGVPNSCNRCHADKSADWAIETTAKWYGEKMQRRSRQRARVIQRAESNDATVLPELLALAQSEEIAAWRSVLIALLAPKADQPEVTTFLEKSLTHESSLVRSAAIRSLATAQGAAKIIPPLCDDSSRLVRLDAVWSLRNERVREHSSYQELMEYLGAICDQPAGALRQTQWALDEGRMDDALKWSARAVCWDANSAAAHQIHAVVLNAADHRREAIAELHTAIQLDSSNAEYPFMLALLYGESGQLQEVIVQLKKCVELDPSYGRAWYNLGLAFAQNKDLPPALSALKQAERLLPDSAEISYALATVHERAGQMEAAKEAAERARLLSEKFHPR